MSNVRKNDAIKTLGVIWQPTNDTFVVSVDRMSENSTTITKRTVLSDIAKLYEPLGLTGPIIVTAKILLQRLWQLQLDWDEPLNMDDYNYWVDFCNRLKGLQHIEVARCVVPFKSPKSLQLVGFYYGSMAVYGTSGYNRCISAKKTNIHRFCYVQSLEWLRLKS
jgi:Pao retrotransposon peptidase